MKRYLISWVLMLVLLASCGGSKSGAKGDADDSLQADSSEVDIVQEALDEATLPRAADELFDDFFFNFAAVHKLQMERIKFPLTVISEDKEGVITKERWKMERFFMPQGYYTLLFDSEQNMEVVKDTSVCHAVVERISFDQQRIRQFIFNRPVGAWMMTEIRDIPMEKSHNATFLAFYHRFATDTHYQQKHLSGAVKFVGPDPDDDFNQMEGIITPDTWEAFAPELPSGTIYNIVYGKPEKEGRQKVFVLRGISNGMELEMTFHKKGSEWKLSKLTT